MPPSALLPPARPPSADSRVLLVSHPPAAMVYLDIWEQQGSAGVPQPSQYRLVLRSNVTLTKPLVRKGWACTA